MSAVNTVRRAESIPQTAPGEAAAKDLDRARGILRRDEVRILQIEGAAVVGVWSDRDSLVIRAALKVVGWGQLPVRYLDGRRVPDRYRGSRLDDQPVPVDVLRAMEADPSEPWRARDRLMAERAPRISWSAEPEPDEPAIDWHVLGHGWAVWVHWRRWDPHAADAYRALHPNDEQQWLLDLGSGTDGHRLKLLLNRLEASLEESRCVKQFESELRYLRERSWQGSGDPLGLSRQALTRFLKVLRRLIRETIGGKSRSLFD